MHDRIRNKFEGIICRDKVIGKLHGRTSIYRWKPDSKMDLGRIIIYGFYSLKLTKYNGRLL
jgi:hypothetical protein